MLQPGHRPPVANVCQTMPQPSNDSGVSKPSQHQRLDGNGRHSQRGHLMVSSSRSSGVGWSRTIRLGIRSSVNRRNSTLLEPGDIVIALRQ